VCVLEFLRCCNSSFEIYQGLCYCFGLVVCSFQMGSGEGDITAALLRSAVANALFDTLSYFPPHNRPYTTTTAHHHNPDLLLMHEDGTKKVKVIIKFRGLLLTGTQCLNMRTSNSPACRPLPADIWGQVLTQVDDFTLWIPCHQISRMIRDEAEREFARTRLSQLKIDWSYRNVTRHGIDYECKVDIEKGIPSSSTSAMIDFRRASACTCATRCT
jgi:hypothetical protein